ncbi:very short patch repair endonuclease [Methylomonas rhizoryzae]|uniref:very short patch repair endonuclease n=1 Tax=Methylomonas rhizoryzae TaxID=2608981 RepID=UPI001231CB88|nr:very short patch repair endonuclease [Methylomonas rhizoryzae]
MNDRVSKAVRSGIMTSVKSKNTGPEVQIRKMLHALGYRYRLHRKELPGSPDIVFPGKRKAIFVHGCFWHGHDCRWGKLPKSNIDYWQSKISDNISRDTRNQAALRLLGWSSLVVWQCELRNSDDLKTKLVRYLTDSEG